MGVEFLPGHFFFFRFLLMEHNFETKFVRLKIFFEKTGRVKYLTRLTVTIYVNCGRRHANTRTRYGF